MGTTCPPDAYRGSPKAAAPVTPAKNDLLERSPGPHTIARSHPADLQFIGLPTMGCLRTGCKAQPQKTKRPRSHRLRSPLLPFWQSLSPSTHLDHRRLPYLQNIRASVRWTPECLCAVRQHEAEYHERPGHNDQSHPNRLHASRRTCHFGMHCLSPIFPGRIDPLHPLKPPPGRSGISSAGSGPNCASYPLSKPYREGITLLGD